MNYQGDINLGDTIDVKFTSVASTGLPTTLSGSPTVAAYVDNSTTEITAGVTLTVDFDARTGLNNVRVVASSGNGFAAATNVNLVITAGTVGGSSVVGYVVGSFSIGKRPVNVTLWAGSATATTNVALKTTLAKTTDITGFNDLSAAQVNTECDTALADVGVTTTVTGRIDAAVSTRATPAQVQTELGTYGALKPTTAGRTLDVTAAGEAGIDLDNTAGTLAKGTEITGFNDIAAGAAMTLTSAYDAAKTASTQASVDAVKVVVDAIKVLEDHLATGLELDGAVYRWTTNALEQAPTGAGGGTAPTAIEVADAVLTRNWSSVSGEAAYSVLNALRQLRNVWDTSGGVLHVYGEDGTTVKWTRTLGTDINAAPIISST